VSYLDRPVPSALPQNARSILTTGAIGHAEAAAALRIDRPMYCANSPSGGHELPGSARQSAGYARVDVLYQLTACIRSTSTSAALALMAAVEYVLFNHGPITSNFADGGAFWWRPAERDPNLQSISFPPAPVPYRSGCSIMSTA